MSEFTNHREKRVANLLDLFYGIQKGDNLAQQIANHQKTIEACIPSDVISLVDKLVLHKIPVLDLKRGVNKILNLLHKTLSDYPYSTPPKESFLGCLVENNRLMNEKLQALKPKIRELNQGKSDSPFVLQMKMEFEEIAKIEKYYAIKENILFPVIESHVAEFRCLSVMWSFQDDIKRNLKAIISELASEELDVKKFNKLAGDIFFNILAVKFREERILYPFVQEMVPEEKLQALVNESLEIGFPFYTPEIGAGKPVPESVSENKIDLETGNLSADQIKLLFNHLPVDITFVDENNKVAYFSTPEKRIFRRTKSILGRDVHNCHPPESVHVVGQIVEAFRSGKKNSASFWINMKGEKYLIQYYAIRNEKGEYKGVVEVSQEISEIQNLTGEKRLLDWED